MSNSLITLSILKSYYRSVVNLRTYLRDILEPPNGERLLDDILVGPADSEQFQDFLNKSYVASTLDDDAQPGRGAQRLRPDEPMVSMFEIIDRAQRRIMSRSKGKVANVITFGYRPAYSKDEGKIGPTRLGISNFFVNTMVTSLQGSEWERLLKRIGEDAMLHLLAETCIFVPLPNECLCQLVGQPIIFLKPPRTASETGALLAGTKPQQNRKRKAQKEGDAFDARKRLRIEQAAQQSTLRPSKEERLTPADIFFDRKRICYARPAYVPYSDNIVAGLPPNHILNRLNPSFHRNGALGQQNPGPRKQMEDARHLSKYVFPRQYGLSNPFTSVTNPYKLPDYADREYEIKVKGTCKTPGRVKTALDLLEKMIWRHGKCAYKPLRDLACPTKLKRDSEETPLDSSVILELMSEQSIYLRSQPSLDASNTSIRTFHGLTQAEAYAKNKPRFTEFTCDHAEVYRYAVLVTKAVIPQTFWGCNANFKSVMNAVKDYICYRRYEAISLHNILQGFSTTSCDWMAPCTTSKLGGHIPASDSLKRRELLEEFIFWYFGSFLCPLLRTTFYITESSAFRNRILYFRQDDWHTLCAPLIDRLSSETFSKLDPSEAEEVLRQRKLGFSFVRLLPKDTGVRPIVNLRRKKVEQKGPTQMRQQSINDILQAAFQILTYEKNAKPELMGASVFGHNEIYSQLKAFKARLLSIHPSGVLPKLYFVKVDVQACFDTIEQSKLLHILRGVLSEDSYVIPRFGQVMQTAGKIKRHFGKRALPDDQHPHFLHYASQLADALRHTILVDQVIYPLSTRTEVLELLEEHITENIVKIGRDYYRQIVGIPQGSVLSSLLCSIFYADLERHHLQFSQDPQSMLLRLIDDYLFVTTDESKARKFLDTMVKGHPEYGCFISQDKTLTNFDYDAQIMRVTAPNQKGFPWCALFIDMATLSVSTDYVRYHENFIVDSLSVDRGRRAGVAFLHKMLQLGRAKSHILFCDTDLNYTSGVYLNLYQNFLVVAMRMHHYLNSWGLNVVKNCAFIHKTIQQVIRYTYSVARNKATNKLAAVNQAHCKIQKPSVIWLGIVAFHKVFSRKPTKYKALLKSLSFDLSLGKNRRYRKEFRRLVQEGTVVMDHLSF